MISPGRTIYSMKKKILRAEKAKMFNLYCASTGGCRDWEVGMEREANDS